MGFRLRVGASVIVLAAGGLTTVAVADDGDGRTFETNLVGYEEVPAVSSQGDGDLDASLNDDESEIEWSLEYEDLESTVLQAHIHFGQKDVNGGIAVFLCTNLGNAPEGTEVQACPQEGEISGTIRAADVVGPAGQGIAPGEFDELVKAVRAGKTYANIHSELIPSGEIRGQIKHEHDDDD